MSKLDVSLIIWLKKNDFYLRPIQSLFEAHAELLNKSWKKKQAQFSVVMVYKKLFQHLFPGEKLKKLGKTALSKPIDANYQPFKSFLMAFYIASKFEKNNQEKIMARLKKNKFHPDYLLVWPLISSRLIPKQPILASYLEFVIDMPKDIFEVNSLAILFHCFAQIPNLREEKIFFYYHEKFGENAWKIRSLRQVLISSSHLLTHIFPRFDLTVIVREKSSDAYSLSQLCLHREMIPDEFLDQTIDLLFYGLNKFFDELFEVILESLRFLLQKKPTRCEEVFKKQLKILSESKDDNTILDSLVILLALPDFNSIQVKELTHVLIKFINGTNQFLLEKSITLMAHLWPIMPYEYQKIIFDLLFAKMGELTTDELLFLKFFQSINMSQENIKSVILQLKEWRNKKPNDELFITSFILTGDLTVDDLLAVKNLPQFIYVCFIDRGITVIFNKTVINWFDPVQKKEVVLQLSDKFFLTFLHAGQECIKNFKKDITSAAPTIFKSNSSPPPFNFNQDGKKEMPIMGRNTQ